MAALVVALPSLARADGVYENCAPSSQCERRLNQLPSRGLGPVLNYWVYQGYQGPGSVIAYARNAWAHGTKLIWPIRSDWTRRQVRWYVTMARDLPATWGYYVGEEGHVTRYAGLVHRVDPDHPRLYVDGPRSPLAPYASQADVLAAECYPVGTPMTAAHCQDVAQHTVDVARARNDRPGMVLQAFGWSQASRSDNCTADCLSGPYPTLDQQRRMREFAVRGGVNFVLWFDLFYVQPLGTWDVGRLDQLAKAIP